MITRAALIPTLILAAASAALAPDARAQETRIIYDRELRAETVELTGMGEGLIRFTDERGRRRETALADVLAIVAAGDEPEELSRALGELRLRSGERIPGEPLASGGGDEEIVWRHPRFGRMSAHLDEVDSVAFDGAGVALLDNAQRAGRDVVDLVNGDRLTGFLIALGEIVEIDTDAGIVQVEAERVRAITLADQGAPPPASAAAMVAWLDDGAVTRLAEIESMERGRVVLRRPSGESAMYSVRSIKGLATEPDRITPLATIKPSAQAAVGDRRTFDPVESLTSAGRVEPLDAADILMPGPMIASWDLPAGAQRLAGSAALDPSAWPWGDCEFVIAVDGYEAFRAHLDQEARSATFNVELDGAQRIDLIVEPGRFGPLNDRVVIQRPLLLIDPPADGYR